MATTILSIALFAITIIAIVVVYSKAVSANTSRLEIERLTNSIAIHESNQTYKDGRITQLATVVEMKEAQLAKEILATDRIRFLTTKVIRDLESEHQKLLANMRVEAIKAEKAIRADAIARSKTVNHGFTSENFAPLLMDFSHKDFRHMGDPIDYLVPVGASEVRAGTKDKIDKVILLDIKTGKAQLNKVQRRIRDAIVEGRIYFATYNTDTSNLRLWPEEKTDGTKSVLELEPKSTPSEEESIAPSDDA